jgi:hypothetical protein
MCIAFHATAAAALHLHHVYAALAEYCFPTGDSAAQVLPTHIAYGLLQQLLFCCVSTWSFDRCIA